MGVDFITCRNEACGYNFPDCGSYFFCTGCETNFCSNDCGGKELVKDENGEPIEDKDFCAYKTTCILCRKESVSTDSLVYFLLKKLGLTYDQAVEMYRKES